MGGDPTTQLKYAMFSALKHLPPSTLLAQTRVNIIGFGTNYHCLFKNSIAPSFSVLHAMRSRILYYLFIN